MTALFAIPLVTGIVLLLAWIGLGAASAMVPEWEGWDPERRFGVLGRDVVSALFGFGMAGMSALYAGWPEALSAVAAVAGAGALVVSSRFFGPVDESDEDEGA